MGADASTAFGDAGVEPYAARLKAKPDEIVSMFEAKDINVVVVGGETQGRGRFWAPATRPRSQSTPGASI